MVIIAPGHVFRQFGLNWVMAGASFYSANMHESITVTLSGVGQDISAVEQAAADLSKRLWGVSDEDDHSIIVDPGTVQEGAAGTSLETLDSIPLPTEITRHFESATKVLIQNNHWSLCLLRMSEAKQGKHGQFVWLGLDNDSSIKGLFQVHSLMKHGDLTGLLGAAEAAAARLWHSLLV